MIEDNAKIRISCVGDLDKWCKENGHHLKQCTGEYWNMFQITFYVGTDNAFKTIPYLWWQFLMPGTLRGKYLREES